MTSYLLLRNNKESGPYSLNDLVSLGLKPYDLVWVKGKSAAWRYPGEIPELQEFAPAVEEQPFDRFYKKPVEEKKPDPVVQEIQPIKQQQQAYVPKKSVFVTMPGQKQQQQVAAAVQQTQPSYSKYQPSLTEADEPETVTKTITITENPVTAEIKYSQPLDEIKEMYVKTLQQRKQRIATKATVIKNAKKIAVVLGIVATGILIGFTLKSNSGKKEAATDAATTTQAVTTGQLPKEPVVTEPVTNDDPQQQSLTVEEYKDVMKKRAEQSESYQAPVNENKQTEKQEQDDEQQPKEAIVVKKNTEQQEPVVKRKETPADAVSPGVDVNAATGERIRKQRSGQEEEATVADNESAQPSQPKAVMSKSSNNLRKLVSVSSNNYQRVAFGGIRNLELTVTNDSKYILDNVTVELSYLKPSEQPLRTENIQFRTISPSGSMTIRIPDTNRGIKVEYRITNILSTQSAKELADL